MHRCTQLIHNLYTACISIESHWAGRLNLFVANGIERMLCTGAYQILTTCVSIFVKAENLATHHLIQIVEATFIAHMQIE